MVQKILDKASYGLVRTNPKLSGNVKLVVDSKDNLYLESFSANTTLSSSKFKSFRVDYKSSYEKDIYNFFQKGKLPKPIAYEVFQQYEDTAVLSNYSSQYEMFYDAGCSSVASDAYTEDLGMLAPIWLNEQIPNYFVIFRIDDPIAVNNLKSEDPNAGIENAQTSVNFSKNVLEKSTLIKTFDMSPGSPLGEYLRNYRNKPDFPKAPLRATWRKDETFQWNGISYDKGGFVSKGEYLYEGLVTQDGTILQDEFLLTQGFQRTGVLAANLINLQFLFTDGDADDYSYNRYFGLYVNSIDEGNFDLSGNGFYKNTEKTQLPKIKTITEVSEQLNTSFNIENSQGILLYLDPSTISTVTGLPTPDRVDEVESIFYVKDKTNKFHSLNKGSNWGSNQLRLADKKIDISLLTGFKEPTTFAKGEVLKERGQAVASFKINNELPVGYRITLYDGPDLIDEIAANTSLTAGPGTAYQQFFNPTGTPQEIAQAMMYAITFGIPEGIRYFDPSINDDTLYLRSRYGGSRFNQLRFEVDAAYPNVIDDGDMIPFPFTTQYANFTGGSDIKNSQIRIDNGAEKRFSTDRYVKTKGGFADILSYTPYLEEPIYDPPGNFIIGYNNINTYNVIQTDEDEINVSSTGQVAVYVDYKPSFGRFSFFPVRDFDFDFFSTEYSEEGELAYEYDEYNPNTFIEPTGSIFPIPIGPGSDPDIIDFYSDGGFGNLIGLLKAADPDTETDTIILSEYERLEENYLKTQAIASRITPYINKWGYYREGKDVRNHPYRLDVSEAFGSSNFAPSQYNFNQDPLGYSHEWYYLSEIPSYFTNEALENSWSYFDKSPTEEIPADPTTGSSYVPGTFQDVSVDGFTNYFLVNRFFWNSQVVQIDKQVRYTTLESGNLNNYSSGFLRGVKIIAKEKAKPLIKPNFNARSLEYLQNGNLNGYKFSCILVPNVPNKPSFEIKFVKNDKWKTITMLIFVSIDWPYINGGRQSTDRTSLYSLESLYKNTGGEIIPNTDGSYDYGDSIMQGSLSLQLSTTNPSPLYYIIKGVPDVNGNPTKFLTDIQLGSNGSFNDIEFNIGGTLHAIREIFAVVSDTELHCRDLEGISGAPAWSPTPGELVEAEYIIKGGGFNSFKRRMLDASFAQIAENVNQGNPSVIYETINKDGSIELNEDGSYAQTFSIELQGQDKMLKSIYVGVLPDPNKPTQFNLTDIIGYDLSLQTTPRVVPFTRHSGLYDPIAKDIFKFRDPYAEYDYDSDACCYIGEGLVGSCVIGCDNANDIFNSNSPTGGGIIPDENYKFKVFNLMRFANTQFYTKDLSFGQIKNFFYHKVNIEDPSTVLELSNESAFKSLYPLINEVGITYKDFYTFSSNWEPGYFEKSIDKSQVVDIIGTRSMQEKKSFFGSKYLKVPQVIELETWLGAEYDEDIVNQPNLVEGTFMYNEDSTKIELYLYIQKRLIDYLFPYVKSTFEKYINPAYSFGNLTTIDDDVKQYITLNILPLYQIRDIELFTQSLREESPTDYRYATFDDEAKFNAGLRITDNFSSRLLNTNQFDTRLIYNKRLGYKERIGMSVSLEKK